MHQALYRSDTMKLSDLIVADAIVPHISADTRDGAITELIEALADVDAIPAGSSSDIAAAILARESQVTTGIGHGISYYRPDHADDRHRREAVHHRADYVLGSHQSGVEHRQARDHQQHQGGRCQHPGGGARIDHEFGAGCSAVVGGLCGRYHADNRKCDYAQAADGSQRGLATTKAQGQICPARG